ncbi:glycosyl hydrolase family 28-related protein [Acholeplasma granularum]|uniref:glycosyl hydrolase family 28-related protein n=1 Tax=Acholeplasma granularum TaxID=264635 RepID=UPI000471DFA3|nr:glycosyl hydrolase family 28-related protein [Acholeplasma granularum]
MIKKITTLIMIIGIIMIFIMPKSYAYKDNYYNVNDYGIYGNDKIDDTVKIQNLINNLPDTYEGIYFPSGKYIVSGELFFAPKVNLKGAIDGSTIIHGSDNEYAAIFRDRFNVDLSNIIIENFIFDNVLIFSNSNNHDRFTIRYNVFINGKKPDMNLMTGLKPNADNLNGGELTAYYISRNYQGIDIYENIFLRDEFSKGRGIATYYNTNSNIHHNYFGLLENYDQTKHLVTANIQRLYNNIQRSSNNNELILNSDQGYFMTAINNLNGDQNIHINNNIIHINDHIEELHYNDKSGLTLGFNQDHLIYSKGFDGLFIYNNYFNGQQNNADGGVKIRNGKNAVIYGNYFDDVGLLLYIQNDHPIKYFESLYVAENTFNIRTNHGLWGSGISLGFYIVESSKDITIKDNQFISDKLGIDHIMFDYRYQIDDIDNLHISNNINTTKDEPILLKITRRKNLADIISKTNIISLNPYYPSNLEIFNHPLNDIYLNEVSYEIIEDSIYSDGDIYVNNQPYNLSKLLIDDEILIIEKDQKLRKIEGVDILIDVTLKTMFTYGKSDENNTLNLRNNESNLLQYLSDYSKIEYDPYFVNITSNIINTLKEGYTKIDLFDEFGKKSSIDLYIYKKLDAQIHIEDSIYRYEKSAYEIPLNLLENYYEVIWPESFQIIDEENLIATQSGDFQIEILDKLTMKKIIQNIRVNNELNFSLQQHTNPFFVGTIVKINLKTIYDKDILEITTSTNLKKIGDFTFEVISFGPAYIKLTNKVTNESNQNNFNTFDYISKINLESEVTQLNIDESFLLKPFIENEYELDSFSFYSSNNDIISVNEAGLLTAKNKGFSVITVQGDYSKITHTFLVNVIEDNQKMNVSLYTVIAGLTILGISSASFIIYKIKMNKK